MMGVAAGLYVGAGAAEGLGDGVGVFVAVGAAVGAVVGAGVAAVEGVATTSCAPPMPSTASGPSSITRAAKHIQPSTDANMAHHLLLRVSAKPAENLKFTEIALQTATAFGHV